MNNRNAKSLPIAAALVSSCFLLGPPSGHSQSPSAPDGTAVKKAAVVTGNSVAGKQVFQKHCGFCHNPNSDAPGQIAPGLKGILKKTAIKLSDGKQFPTKDQNVRQFISTGNMNMPAQGKVLSDKELADVVAYLRTL